MFLLSLLTCLVLSTFSTFSAQAKVVDSFNECKDFFYQGTEPKGMDQNAVKICQKLQNRNFLYATLYSVYNRIPLYSAYKFIRKCSGSSTFPWHVEPQLSFRDKPDYMVLERDIPQEELDILQEKQAVSRDYEKTGYDRGHLYPNSFQHENNRKATFTLTNAAPMDACFNRIHWKIWEGYLKTFLNSLTITGSVYIVTGTVPGEKKIPESENRVSVPSHIWTAVCYEDTDSTTSFSFGYIGINQPEFNIKLMSIPEMNEQLDQLYENQYPSVEIFHDNCFSNQQSSEDAQDQFYNLINLPEYQRLQMSKSAQSNFLAVQKVTGSDSPPAKKPKITELTATFAFDSSSSYFPLTEKLKKKSRTACVINSYKKQGMSDLRKLEVYESSESLECQLVPEKSVEKMTAADGSSCTNSHDDGNVCMCLTEKKKCCSTPCLYQDELKDYQCYSGSKEIKCSPQYSLVAINGKRCRDDHPCATYGKDYYWCYTETSWEYCSPPLWQSRAKDGKYCRSDYACAKYSKEEPWCYTDDNNWNYCCTSDNCISAVNYKTCKSNYPCGYYDKNYLWCYTTDGSWNYCCKLCT